MGQRQVLDKEGNWRTGIHYDISSLKGVVAKQMQKYIRSHWRIENSCHWALDTLFREDHNQTGKRNAAKNLGPLRRMALNALKEATDQSKRKRPSSLRKNSSGPPMTNPTSKRSSPLCRDPDFPTKHNLP